MELAEISVGRRLRINGRNPARGPFIGREVEVIGLSADEKHPVIGKVWSTVGFMVQFFPAQDLDPIEDTRPTSRRPDRDGG